MSLLHLVLEEGFEDETVTIKVDGKEVFRDEHVKTRLQIGRAATREIPIGAGQVSVEISLPGRNLSQIVQVQTSDEAYLYCSLLPDRIECRVSATPSSFYA
jgi:hypothetical protein